MTLRVIDEDEFWILVERLIFDQASAIIDRYIEVVT